MQHAPISMWEVEEQIAKGHVMLSLWGENPTSV